MTRDQQARQAFEILIGNILVRIRAAPEDDREALFDQTRQGLYEVAIRHGLTASQAARWAGELDQELRFRMQEEEAPPDGGALKSPA